MNSFSEDGSTPLILAAEMDNKRVVSALVNKGAQIDYADASEKTALYWAANENAIDSLQVGIFLVCISFPFAFYEE